MIYEDYNSLNSIETYMLKGVKGNDGPQGIQGPKGDTGLAGASSGSVGQGYGICDTASSTTAKTVSITGVQSLAFGMIFSVNFLTSVPANSTLQINSTSACPIYFRGEPLAYDGIINPGDIATFMYCGNPARYILIALDPGAAKGVSTTSVDGNLWKYRNGGIFGVQECWTNGFIDVTIPSGQSYIEATYAFPISFSTSRPNAYITVFQANISQPSSGTISYNVIGVSNANVRIRISRTINQSAGVFSLAIRAEA